MIKTILLILVLAGIAFGTAVFQVGYQNHSDCAKTAQLDQLETLWAPVGYRFLDNSGVSLPYKVCIEAKKLIEKAQ